MPRTQTISPKLFAFFRALKKNNDREWFEANKERYERDVREPLLQLIRDFAPMLEKISAQFVASDKKVGGSLFRIYRDVRFSADKSPYKTAAGIHFRHKRGKDAHVPGFYLHLEPGNVFGGVGVWCPQPRVAQDIRDIIAADPDGWTSATRSKGFTRHWEIVRENALKRPPRGIAKDHPLVEDLKLKQFIAVTSFSEEEALRPGFLRTYAWRCEAGAPFVRFLTEALGEPW